MTAGLVLAIALFGNPQISIPRLEQKIHAVSQRLQAMGSLAGGMAGSGWWGALAAETHWEAARVVRPV